MSSESGSGDDEAYEVESIANKRFKAGKVIYQGALFDLLN